MQKKDNDIIYIQVSETIKDEQTRKIEFNAFEKINDYYPRYIITNDILNYSRGL